MLDIVDILDRRHARASWNVCLYARGTAPASCPAVAFRQGCFRENQNSENIHRYGKALRVDHLQNNPPGVASEIAANGMATQQIPPYAPPQTGFPGPGNAVRLHANNQDRFGS
jgi:hypothetical protein